MRKWIKRLAVFLAVIVFLIIALILFLHTPWGKSIVSNEVRKYLVNKLKTPVEIGKIDYRLPAWIQIKDLLVLDRNNDTLLYSGNVYVNLRMLKLLQSSVDVNAVQLDDIVLNVSRDVHEAHFNVQFVLDAFSGSSGEADTAVSTIDTTKSDPWDLHVGAVSLNRIRLKFVDKKEKQYYSLRSGMFYCQPERFRLEKNAFHINELISSDCSINMIDSSKTIVNPTGPNENSPYEPPSMYLALKKLGIRNFQLEYKKPLDQFDVSVLLDTMQMDVSSIDMKQQLFTSKSFLLHDSKISLNTLTKEKKANDEKELIQQTAESTAWNARLDYLDLYNNTIIYHDKGAKPVEGFDYNNMEIENFNLASSHNKLDGNSFYTQIDSCSLIANKKIKLRGLRTNASYTDSILLMRDLEIGLNQSALITQGDLAWELKTGKKSGKGKFNCRIQPSTISYADLLLIQPGLKKTLPIELTSTDKLTLAGNLNGSLNDFTIDQLQIKTRDLQFNGDASLNLTNNKQDYSLRIDKLNAQKKLLSKSLLAELQKQAIYLPESINATGKVNGTFDKASADLKIASDYGDIRIKGDAGNFSKPENLYYNADMDLKEFETGKWIGMDSILGRISGKIIAKGSGTELSKINGTSILKINSFVLNGYNYKNVDIDAELNESAFTAKGTINDSNLVVNLDLNGTVAEKYPSVKGLLDIDKADLHQLGFTKDSVSVSTRLNIDAPVTDLENLSVKLFADSNILLINGKKTVSDSIWINANSSADKAEIDVHSGLMIANVNTNYSLEAIAGELENIANRLNPFSDSVASVVPNNHITNLNATLNQHELISKFVPGLEIKDPIIITGKYSSNQKDSFFLLNANAPSFSYNGIQFDDFNIKANNKDELIRLVVNGNSIRSSSDTFYKPFITASWENQLLTVGAQIEDKKGQTEYAIKSSVQSEKNTTTIKILEDLTLNGRNWEVPKDNMVMIKQDGYIFQNFSIVNKAQAIYITSKDPETISPINIRIDSFEIGEILSLASFSDTALATGNLSAAINIKQPIAKFPEFTGNLGIKKLTIQAVPVGDLEINSHSLAEKLELNGKLKGNSDLEFSGNIDPTKGDLDLNAKIQKLNMKLVREFISDYVSRASGNISGDLQLTGTTSDPQFNGYVHFDTTTFALTELNTPYRIDDQRIEIKYPDFQFKNFTLTDTTGNKLTVDGTVKMIDASEFGLNLKANTKHFVALDAPRRSESIIYGKAILDIDLDVKGTSNEPIIDGKGFLNGQSNVHYIMVESKSDYTNTGKGMIQFVDLDTLASPDEEMAKLKRDTTIKIAKTFKGLKYNLNLEVSKDAEFSILIDPATGDELVIKGEANLNTGVAENGMMGVTGTYQLHSGYYNMNTKFLKGKFLLVEGSTITFSGDPTQAEADVTTEYEIDASASGLLRPVEEQEYNTSKRLPFLIVLTIKGPISSPELAFDIKMKQGATGIPNSLKSDVEEQLALLRNDQSAMNQQVFSLLVMNQFTVYNTGDFASSDLSPDVALKQGMSQFLAQGMNEIAGNLIKGVDINVNMESYKTNNSQTRTEMGFEMSKDMMNDRLTVTVGKNFQMGEDAAKYQNSAEQYIPDISTAYKLSRDGRYQVKAYRKNEYDAVVEGYFTETGVAFSIQLEYNLFKQIFQSQKKAQKE